MTITIKRFMQLPALLVALLFAGCATLTISPDKTLTPATDKQPVSVGIQASGERLRDVLKDSDGSLVKTATGTLFDKVILLPVESKFQQPAEIAATHGVDYILSVGISDISVSGELNPIWFISMPLLFFKPFTPIVTFQPTVSVEVSLKDARSSAVILNKEIMESSSDYYSPMSASEKVRDLISRTIKNALITVMRDSQSGIALARNGQKRPQ